MHPFYNFFLRFKNQTLLRVLGVISVLYVLGYFIPVDTKHGALVGAALLYAGVALLLKNGTFVYSKYVRFLSVLFALFIVAILFKILNLQGANILLIAIPVGVTLLYAVWFFNKPQKQLLDILKLLWVPVFLASVLFKMLHWLYSIEINLSQLVLFIIILAIFITQNYKRLSNT